jgi:UDP:flavonoid glycosyltransferase YjiC (YdhE family)
MIWSGLWFLLLSPRFRSLKRARTAAGFDSPLPYFDLVQPVLCSGTMALDLPANPSDRVIAFGPILQQYPPLQDTDPEMAAWLAKGGKGKTIMVVLGSLFRFDEAEVRKMMSAVAEVLRKRQDMQVLWKLAPDAAHEGARGDLESMVQRLEGRLTVVDWLRADPAALLQTGYIGAAVHHGGANSYHEALRYVQSSRSNAPRLQYDLPD